MKQKITPAVILAAGMGSRLKEFNKGASKGFIRFREVYLPLSQNITLPVVFLTLWKHLGAVALMQTQEEIPDPDAGREGFFTTPGSEGVIFTKQPVVWSIL